MKITFTFFLLFFAFCAKAQRCATSEYSRLHPVTLMRPSGAGVSSTKTAGRDTLNNEVIIIPVVIHILYNTNDQNISDKQVLSQITSLNNDYRRLNTDTVNTPAPFKSIAADTRIVFCLAKVDPEGNYTTGIIRKYTHESNFLSDDAMKFSSSGGDDGWDASRYLNIWVCNLFGRTLGYSTLPGCPAERDGIVIKYNAFGTTGLITAPYNKGRTTTHEIGHWLGLRHLWGDANCGDDGIADTPPQETSNSYCPVFPHLSSCSINSYGDMFMDYMDFTDDACMNMFTQGQKSEMRSLFALGNARNSFLNSSVCDSSNAQGGPLPSTPPKDSITISAPLTITTYPNPFYSDLTVAASDESAVIGKVLKLYNITGKLITSRILQSQKTVLHIGELPSGIYFIKIEGNKSPLVYKLIKQSGVSR
ncbi:MAG: M43 family zinc metalloprotease [Bacteroidota bacterium]|nr:M43 family zinc metalloprotease [Bacteroidota bacterium]